MQQNKIADETAEKDEYVDELKSGTQLLQGQYTIDSFLNSGGFGITYLAKDSLDRRIVIKECFPGSFCRRSAAIVGARSRAHQNEFKSIVKLFIQEARSLAKLVHPNIVGVHQVFEDNDTAYMAIDFIDGRDLLELIEDSSTSFTPEQVIEMTKKLLSAVNFIHDNEILHRDISPDNILIQKDGEPILIDFGAAREQATKASRALSALRVVKDGYSPQEFYVAGSSQGPWSDLYALAASLFHLITGEPPVNSQVRLAAVAEGRGDPYVPLAGKYEGYPAGFLEAVDKAMKTVPNQRVQNAQEWLDMFQNPEGKEKIVPLKVEKGDATKAVGPQTAAVKKVMSAEKAKAEEPQTKAAGGSKSSGMKMALMGTAALVVVAAGIGFVTNSGGSDAVETAAQTPVLSTTPAVKPAAPTPTPAAPQTAAAKPTTPQSTAATTSASKPAAPKPAAKETPKVVTAEPTLQPMVNTSSSTFADIISSRPVAAPRPTTATRAPATPVPTTATPSRTTSSGANGALSFADIIAAKPSARQPAAPAARQATPTVSVAPRASGSNATGGLSFADIIAAKPTTRPAAQPTMANRATTASTATQQVNFSVWNVNVPFTTTNTRRNGQTVALITKATPSTALRSAGSWVQEGVEITALNGVPIAGGSSIGTLVLKDLNMDAKGIARVPVTIRRVGAQNESPETLVLSAVRQIALKNGIEVEARVVSGQWQTKVTKGSANAVGLQTGDVLLREKTTGVALNDSRSLEQIMGDLVTGNASAAQFEVQRLNRRASIAMNLK